MSSYNRFSLKGLLLLVITLGALAKPLADPKVGGVQCGPRTCSNGDVCCNESCGICTKPGGFCIQKYCGPKPVPCGPNNCAVGQTCCNESCGICTAPGGKCTEQLCKPVRAPAQCGPTKCPAGQECCNSSCGICTPPGGVCTQQFCQTPKTTLETRSNSV